MTLTLTSVVSSHAGLDGGLGNGEARAQHGSGAGAVRPFTDPVLLHSRMPRAQRPNATPYRHREEDRGVLVGRVRWQISVPLRTHGRAKGGRGFARTGAGFP